MGNGERGRNGERDLLSLHVFSFSQLNLHFLILLPFSLFSLFPHFLSLHFLILSLSPLHFLFSRHFLSLFPHFISLNFLILSPFPLHFFILLPVFLPLYISKFCLHFIFKISNLALLMPNCLNEDVFSVLLLAGRLNLRHLSQA